MHGVNFQNGEDAMDLLTSSEVIHCAQQKIFLKCKGKEDRNKFLRLMVSIVTVASPVSEKSVAIQITDDDDPFVLYMLIISESDFQSIKEQQGLLIEYDKFPQQLVKLFLLCNEDGSSGGNYHLMIEEVPGEVFGAQHSLLKIIETNQFKQLCHLSLAIHVGTDTDIKKHMAVQMKMLKESLAQSETRAKQAETRSQDLIRRLEAKEHENDQLKERWCEESKTIHAQTRLELSAERDSFVKSQEDLKKAFEYEKRQLQDLLEDTKRNFESLISSLQAENKTLYEQTCEADSKVRELTRKQSTFEKDFCTLQREAAMLRTQNSKLDSDYHEKEKNLNTLRMKFAVLEQELKDKDCLLAQQKELLRVAHEQKALLEMNLNEKDNALQRRKSSLKSLSEELVKANEIIGKLNKELSVTKNKLKLRTNITLEQEVLLSEREKEIAALKKQVDECCIKISQLENMEKQLQENLADAKAKIAEKDTTLSNNTNLINWLNRRVNELQMTAPKDLPKDQRIESAIGTLTTMSSTPNFMRGPLRMYTSLESNVTGTTSRLQNAENIMPVLKSKPTAADFVTPAQNSKPTNSEAPSSVDDRLLGRVSYIPSTISSAKTSVEATKSHIPQKVPALRSKGLNAFTYFPRR